MGYNLRPRPKAEECPYQVLLCCHKQDASLKVTHRRAAPSTNPQHPSAVIAIQTSLENKEHVARGLVK